MRFSLALAALLGMIAVATAFAPAVRTPEACYASLFFSDSTHFCQVENAMGCIEEWLMDFLTVTDCVLVDPYQCRAHH